MAALFFAMSVCAEPVLAQRSGASPVLATPPAAAQGVDGHLDPEAATRAYLATLPSDKKAQSDAYFEGGYWLTLWDFLIPAIIYLLLLSTGFSARMRDTAERMTRLADASEHAVLGAVPGRDHRGARCRGASGKVMCASRRTDCRI